MPAWWRRIAWRKIGILLISLFLFILAIQLLKSGARVLVPFVRDVAVSNPVNALGFGWLFAYVVLSGSPVAATSLTLLDVGAIDEMSAFTMITGSRFGAAFIVLVIGFIYTLRGHERQSSLTMGLLSLIVTFTTYLPALGVGYGLLRAQAFDWLRPTADAGVVSVLDLVFDPIIELAGAHLPQLLVFALGFGVLWFSLNLIDRALPNFRLEASAFSGMARLLYRPLVTFGLGLAITCVTMSVSVSLSVLVPLSARGYIRRENVIPYIMGANISTFVDTLVAALLIANPAAFVVVLVEMISVAIVSVAILLTAYRPFERAVLEAVESVGSSRRNLAIFIAAIIAAPIALMLIR